MSHSINLLGYLIGSCLSGLIFCIMCRLGDTPPYKWKKEEWPLLFVGMFLSWIGTIVFTIISLCILVSKIEEMKVTQFLTKERPISSLFKKSE